MADQRYARLTETINVSEDFTELANDDPLAAVVYVMSWTKCWPWGGLPGKAVEFKARVCPGLEISRERMQTILDLLDERRFIIAYEAPDGTPLRFACNWHKHNPVRWQMVSLPQYAPPPFWTPPAEFEAWVSQHPTDTIAKWWQRQTVTNGYKRLQGGGNGLQEGVSKQAPEPKVEEPKVEEAETKAEAPAEKPKRTRKKTPIDLTLERCLRVFGVDPEAGMEPEGWAKYAKAMKVIIAKSSLEELESWVEGAEGEGGRELGTGAKPEARVPSLVRKELEADEWTEAFAKRRAERAEGEDWRGRSKNGRRFLICGKDGVKCYEGATDDRFSYGDGLYINYLEELGIWNPKTGRTTEPHKDWACDDGNWYPMSVWPEGVPIGMPDPKPTWGRMPRFRPDEEGGEDDAVAEEEM